MEIIYEPCFNACECPSCETIFVPEARDIDKGESRHANNFKVECPTCGTYCTVTCIDLRSAWIHIDDEEPANNDIFIAKVFPSSELVFCDRYNGNKKACRVIDGKEVHFYNWIKFMKGKEENA